jgi:hypothetical protein
MTALNCLLVAALLAGASQLSLAVLAQEAAPQAAAPAPATELVYSNKWRVEVSEGANNDGDLLFRLTPKDGAPADVRVHLKDGRGEDGCARDIRDAFKATLDKKAYNIDIDDGEDVLVKKRRGPDFALQLVESTVKGTRIHIDRE